MVKVKKSKIHGKGVFAKKDIPKDTKIGVYEGRRVKRDGTYVLWVCDDNDEWHGINGSNDLKYLNHSSKANCEIYNTGELYAQKDIKKGEEVTIHYGENWEGIP